MFRTLVKTEALGDRRPDGRRSATSSSGRMRGARRYSAEILLGPGDRIILDDDSVTNLEARTSVPRAGDALQPDAGRTRDGRLTVAYRRGRAAQRRSAAAALLARAGVTVGDALSAEACERTARYLRGSTASFSCFAIRAFTTVFAGILIASPVAGLRPIRALRF